tara:strand:+ start:243 stop:449 length:207 start_codon:yes stop_codon:yes gene_type:complete
MENKLGLYITNLMITIQNTEEQKFVRKLALEQLIKLKDDISSFIFQHIDDVEELPDLEENTNQMEMEL